MKNKIIIAALVILPLLASSCSHKAKDSSTSDVEIHKTDDSGINVKAYFAYDSSRLNHKARRALRKEVAPILRANKNAKIVVEGHCDERGTNQYNLILGKDRAKAVKNYLVRKGVKSSRIKTVSYGESRPVDRGHDEEAWAKNRRAVTISIK